MKTPKSPVSSKSNMDEMSGMIHSEANSSLAVNPRDIKTSFQNAAAGLALDIPFSKEEKQARRKR